MWRSYNKGAFVKALKRLIPEIEASHLVSAPAGIRAQAVSPDGGLVDDFLIAENSRIVNVCNAPFPRSDRIFKYWCFNCRKNLKQILKLKI